jgi:methyltransferase OMS1
VSSWGIISWWQQRRLNRHVGRWGCYWNRDILGIVKAAGLRVVELRRSNFGTIYFIRCQRPDAPPDD